ncbi:MAG TPA: HepT-like ribonuclease domain-containing protein [Candidatus Thermoplasmatota archaeon]|nr:HepT-like ribonuclease domain-containing protein [Candidatus Thermoplasmatota archaeon]
MSDERRLRDILDAADELATYLKGRDEDAFAEDRLRQRAVERLLTIIGEAAKNLGDGTRAAIDQPWREIIRFRDKGIHAYDSLTPRTLYRIATEAVPALARAITGHLPK